MTPLKQADAIAIVQPIEATVTVGPFARLRPAGPLAVAIVCVALFAVGCGGQSTPRFNEANVMTSALRFVACMRSHGVPNMPDPQVFHSAGKTGIVIPDSASSSAQFKSAQQACHALLSLGAVANTSQTASTRAQKRKLALGFAVCMRSHGVPNFPDPNTQGSFTSKLRASAPQVQLANKACQKTLPIGDDPLSGGPVPAP